MKIAFASLGNPRSYSTWSGIPAHILNALEQRGHEIIPITLLAGKEPWYYNWLRRFYLYTQKRWFLAAVEQSYLKNIGNYFDSQVAEIQPEVVIVIHGDWLSHTTFQEPACIIHDTTFAKLVDYYPAFSNLTSRSVRMGNDMYQRALNRASAAVFSAHWASESAILDYNTESDKVFTIPFGANIESTPDTKTIGDWILERAQTKYCNFLFLGVDWKRKGGPDALRFVLELNRIGIRSFLTIVGCEPEIPSPYDQFVNRLGFLRKDNLSELSQLLELFRVSHALLLPSLAECYGCVYCEANAFGLPALARATGGVTEIIKEGVNGLLLNSGESPETLAHRWARIWKESGAYAELCFNSKKAYEENLNYNVFLTKLEKILSDLTLRYQ